MQRGDGGAASLHAPHQRAPVRDGILRFYERFSAGDAAAFAEVIADGEGGRLGDRTGPGEGHDERDDWIATYGQMMAGEMAGTRLRGNDPRAYAQGSLGWGVDEPSFVFPDGSTLTAVLREDDGDGKVVHRHFSVRVPDEEAMQLRRGPATA